LKYYINANNKVNNHPLIYKQMSAIVNKTINKLIKMIIGQEPLRKR